jgi:hypothetical protein
MTNSWIWQPRHALFTHYICVFCIIQPIIKRCVVRMGSFAASESAPQHAVLILACQHTCLSTLGAILGVPTQHNKMVSWIGSEGVLPLVLRYTQGPLHTEQVSVDSCQQVLPAILLLSTSLSLTLLVSPEPSNSQAASRSWATLVAPLLHPPLLAAPRAASSRTWRRYGSTPTSRTQR